MKIGISIEISLSTTRAKTPSPEYKPEEHCKYCDYDSYDNYDNYDNYYLNTAGRASDYDNRDNYDNYDNYVLR